LLTTPVGGFGLMLHFNFQLALIIWASLLAAIWLVIAMRVDPELLQLGLHEFRTPQQVCAVVAWGHEKQQSVLGAKVLFICIAYSLSFALAILHAVCQLRRFQAACASTKSMGDFAALCCGIPSLSGSDHVEERLRSALETDVGLDFIGLSVCWDFNADVPAVMDAIEWDLDKRQRHAAPNNTVTVGPAMNRGLFRRTVSSVDQLLGFGPGSMEPTHGDDQTGYIVRLLHELKTSGHAIVVFKTEIDRDNAVRMSTSSGGFPFDGCQVQLEKVIAEPESVQWEVFTRDLGGSSLRLCIGVVGITGAVTLWALLIYLPYAYYLSSHSYARGSQPSRFSSAILTLIVLAGNQTIYFVCRRIAGFVRCLKLGQTEALYVAMYTAACSLNVALDMMVTALICYKIMVAKRVHTFDGALLSSLSSVQDIFESYPMQKAVGSQLGLYCFPCCFALPFLIEPIVTVFLPYKISSLWVGCHPYVRGARAEKAMAILAPMDLGRYADCMLNATLAVMMMFFPSGFFLPTFLALIVSHTYIYLYDHYRVLRAVPGFNFALSSVDDCANYLMIGPCGLMLACLVWKTNGFNDEASRHSGAALYARCLGAFAAHTFVHWFVLHYIVPRFGRSDASSRSITGTFEDVASKMPRTWFTLNPVHCLRSAYIYGRPQPCLYAVRGKEHLVTRNPKECMYFDGDYSSPLPMPASPAEANATSGSISNSGDDGDITN
jgi:hypothetical protein